MPETALDLLNMKSLFEFLLKRFLAKVHRGKSVLDRECSPIMPIYNVYFQFAAAYFQTNSSKDETNKTDRLYPLQSKNGNLIVGINKIMTAIIWETSFELQRDMSG